MTQNSDKDTVNTFGKLSIDAKRDRSVKKAVNIAAAGFTAVAGVGLAATAGDALKNTPSPIIQEAPEQDPLNRKPPKGVVFTPQVPQGVALQNLQNPRTTKKRQLAP